MRQAIFIVLFLSGVMSALWGGDITVSVSKNAVGMNESFSVVFSSKQTHLEHPDFSPLETDFTILSSNQSQQSTFINGVFSHETRWSLVLMGKHEGQLTIPSIQFGPDRSEPKTIEVTGSHQIQRDETLFLETEVQPTNAVYEQTQIIYTVRLYTAVNLGQAALSELKVNDPDVIIERLGNDVEYEFFHTNGTRYIVFERKYAVFPQHPGELVFSPVVFEGHAIVGNRSFFNFQGEFKRLISDEVKVEVKPIPAPFQKNNWFAAKNVQLTQEWSGDPNAVALGEPITWTLTLTAEGCLGNQIPMLSLNFPNAIKHYSDKPSISNQLSADGVTGVKQIKVALIATKVGTVTIPELTVHWWDLKEDQPRLLQLPAQTLQVQEGQIAMNTMAVDPVSINPDSPPVQEQSPHPHELPLWAWCLIGMNSIWVVGLLIFLINKISFRRAKPDSLKHIKQGLKNACQAHDAKKAEEYLLAWGDHQYPQEKYSNIMGLKQHLSEEFQEAIDELYHALYGRKESWRGDALWKAIAAHKQIRLGHHEKKAEGLRELYPTQ